jgi:hypothetical protein
MSTFWKLLQKVPGQAAVPAIWKNELGVDFEAIRKAFLRQQTRPATTYPCPNECGCAHEILRRKDDSIVAVCRCKPSNCSNIRLTKADTTVLELDWTKLGPAVTQAFGLDYRQAETGASGMLQIATCGNDDHPVILTAQTDREAFCQSITKLTESVRGRFLLIVPTSEVIDAAGAQMLLRHGAIFLPLHATIQGLTNGALTTQTQYTDAEDIHELCRAAPTQMFLYWQSLQAHLYPPPSHGTTLHRFLQAISDAHGEWYEQLGHWRDLKPKSKDLDPDDPNINEKHRKQVDEFVAMRKNRLRVIQYDMAMIGHRVHNEMSEHESVEYNWEFFRDGDSQLIVRTAGGNVPPHSDPLKRQYFKNTLPSGYAILESGDKLEGSVFFPNGDSYGFDPYFGDANRFYPEELFQAGDYELRRVPKKGSTLEAVHADVRETKENTSRLPNIEKTVVTVHKHVQGVPILQAEHAEAKVIPNALAAEIYSRILDVLTPEQLAICNAMRKAAGSQKDALPLLRQAGTVKSAPTLSRRVREINAKLVANNLPPCDAPAPPVRYNRSGGYMNEDGKTVPEELSQPDRDWAESPESRDNTIRLYLGASDKDKAVFRDLYYGIEDEADQYKKRTGMKSD